MSSADDPGQAPQPEPEWASLPAMEAVPLGDISDVRWEVIRKMAPHVMRKYAEKGMSWGETLLCHYIVTRELLDAWEAHIGDQSPQEAVEKPDEA